MTLRMADGPPGNLPPGMDAYAGYTDLSGIGVTWPEVQALTALHHLSISVHGQAPAMCGDVEGGALTTWKGYDYGYCNLGNVGNCIRNAGRPRKLWVAHYTLSPHICSQQLCDPTLHLTALAGWVADGTQWTTHGNRWDESLLADDFFAPVTPPTPPLPKPTPVALEEPAMFVAKSAAPASVAPQPIIQPGVYYLVFPAGSSLQKYVIETGSDLTGLQAKLGAAVPLTCSFLANIPNMP